MCPTYKNVFLGKTSILFWIFSFTWSILHVEWWETILNKCSYFLFGLSILCLFSVLLKNQLSIFFTIRNCFYKDLGLNQNWVVYETICITMTSSFCFQHFFLSRAQFKVSSLPISTNLSLLSRLETRSLTLLW